MTKDTGYYVVHNSISNYVGLQYCSAGNDPGMSLKDAVEYLLDHPDMRIIDAEGKTVLQYGDTLKSDATH